MLDLLLVVGHLRYYRVPKNIMVHHGLQVGL